MICKKKNVVMGSPKKKIGEHIWIWCPGCNEAHVVRVVSLDGKGVWKWNGSLETPTFFPSLLVSWGPKSEKRCHSFIKDGKIGFLSDCSHDLAGKEVPLPDLPDWLANE